MNHDKIHNKENVDDRGDWDLPHDLKQFEAQLQSLSPRSDRLDRERLIFLAGQASVEGAHAPQSEILRQHWAWPASFASMTAIAATLLVVLLLRTSNVPMPLASSSDLATNKQIRQTTATDPASRIARRSILSTAPNQLNQIDQLLTSDSHNSMPNNSSTNNSSTNAHSTRELVNRNILSPVSIHKLINEPAASDHSPFDSSYFSPNTGANS